jgi:nucleotide-binding universal stress UspA family protein
MSVIVVATLLRSLRWCDGCRTVHENVHPVVVAFDGSDAARAAVTAAAGLFTNRPLVIVSVWEPGLAMVAQSYPDPLGSTYALPTPEELATVDRVQREHAGASAEAGARLARSLGATAEALAMPDSGNIAEAIDAVAEQRDAAALVVGSRGLGAVKSTLFGSTSRRLLHDSQRPVLVVRAAP